MTLKELEEELMQNPEYARYSRSFRGKLQRVWIDTTIWIKIHWRMFVSKLSNK